MRPHRFGAICRVLVLAIAPAFLAVPLSAQVVERGRTLEDLIQSHPCASGLDNRIARVTDCDAADDFGDGGGAFQCWAYCDGSAPWTNLAIGGGGGGGDVLLAGDADGQTIQGWVGSDAARVDIGGTTELAAKLIGGGATSGIFQADDNGAYGTSPDGQTSVEVTNSGVSLVSSAGGMLTVASDGGIRLLSGVSVPTNANDPCTTGTIKLSDTFIYFCYTTDAWVRVAMATWP